MLARPKMGAAPPLLTLRDLLELACESSCSDGFRSYPRRLPWHGDDAVAAQAKAEAAVPVRLLITAGLRRSPSRTLSSILFPRSPRSLAAVSRLTRSLSRRLVFWRRHRDSDEDVGSGDGDDDERDSIGLPSPVVSSCSASECAAEADQADAADLLALEEGQASGASDVSEKPSPSTSSGCCTGSVDDGAADGDGHKEALDGDPVGSSMEEKQQLSPVSVLDFPFHHDEDDDGDDRSDAGTCSPSSFLQCQPDLERSNPAHELLHKVRRLDGLAQAAVDPVDLEPRFVIVASDDSGESDDTTQAQSNSSISTDDSAATASSMPSDEKHPSADDAESEPDAHRRLLAQLLDHDGDDKQAAVSVAATERLLLDFFAEGLDQRRSPKPGPVVGTVKMPDHDRDEPALVRAAREWLQGLGTQWGVEDVLFSGGVALADMDRERRWTCFAVEEREVGVAVEGLVMDALVAELVSELAARC